MIISNIASGAGGGLYGGMVQNCTIVKNHAAQGGGMYNGVVSNSVLYFNTADSGSSNYAGDSINASYSCLAPLPFDGIGNQAEAPLFVSLDGDYHLTTQSPCIDAGAPGMLTGQLDMDGAPRIFNEVVDIGAFEANVIAECISEEPERQIRWRVPIGMVCQMQYTTNLAIESWQAADGVFTTATASISMPSTNNNCTAAYYRLVWLK